VEAAVTLHFAKDRVQELALQEPLQHLLPFDPRVLTMMRSHGVLIVNPDVRDKQSILAALDSESVSADLHQDAAFSMSFGCGNDNGKLLAKSEDNLERAAEGSLQCYGIVDPHHPGEDELEQHLEADWQHRCDHAGARLAVPPAMDDRRYYKDVSQTHCPQDATERTQPCHFFPDFHKQFVEADNERIRGEDGKVLIDETTNEFKAAYAEYLRTCPTRNSKELVHALFLHQLRYHRCSLPTLSHVTFDGVAGFYYLYLKQGFQFFNLHVEQMLYPFVHHQLEGESLWFIIPDSHLHDGSLFKLAAHMYRKLYNRPEADEKEAMLMGRALLYSKQLFPPPSLYKKFEITVWKVRLSAGRILMGRGGFAHCGYSLSPGKTISVATNVATDEWLKDGLPFVVKHYEYLKELEDYMRDLSGGNKKVMGSEVVAKPVHGAGMLGAKDLVKKAISLCPPNVACSMAKALGDDLKRQEDGQETLSDYLTVQCADAATHIDLCAQLVQRVHTVANFTRGHGEPTEAICCDGRKQPRARARGGSAAKGAGVSGLAS